MKSFPKNRPFIRLSYDIDENAPHFPSIDPLEKVQRTSIPKGDANNMSAVKIHAHYGTHVDAPYHFNNEGPQITDFDVNHYYFKNPLTVEIPKEEGQPITQEEIKKFEDAIKGKDLLLIQTGYSRYRENPLKYLNTPYLEVDGAQYLIGHFPGLRALGIDCVSILNPKFRPIGVEAHRILLGYYNPEKFILLLEDLNLNFGHKVLEEVIALPLFIKDVEAFPCTIIAR